MPIFRECDGRHMRYGFFDTLSSPAESPAITFIESETINQISPNYMPVPVVLASRAV